MAATVMTYLSFVPVSLFVILIAVNFAIIVARAAHHEEWAVWLQSGLNRVSWLFRLGGGTHQRP